MQDQHKKITGYRDLNKSEIELMNKIKAHAEATRELLAEVGDIRAAMQEDATAPLSREQYAESKRCIALAKTELQTGFMWFVRGVALPQSF